MLDYLFDNVGEKIKVLAKVIFVINIIGFVIAAIAVIHADVSQYTSYRYSETHYLYVGLGLAFLLGGPIVSLVGSWLMYGFGCIVEASEKQIERDDNQCAQLQKTETKKIEYSNTENTNYDANGFNLLGIHKDTGTKYNPAGYDKNGVDKNGYTKKEEEEAESEIKEDNEYRKDTRKTAIKTIVGIAIFVIVICVAIISYKLSPSSEVSAIETNYLTGISFYMDGDYDKALSMFKSIGSYKRSSEYISACERAMGK